MFNQYFKRKLIWWISVGITAIMIRLLGGHQISFLYVFTIFLFFVLVAFTTGYIDYRFYEKSQPKLIAQLLDKEPLLSFQKIGFVKEGVDMLEGVINNYGVILSPLINIENDKLLTVLIPLQIREGLDKYFSKYNDDFLFRLSGEIIFAEAVLNDYERLFDYNKILQLIDTTISSLKENKIEPLNIITK